MGDNGSDEWGTGELSVEGAGDASSKVWKEMSGFLMCIIAPKLALPNLAGCAKCGSGYLRTLGAIPPILQSVVVFKLYTMSNYR